MITPVTNNKKGLWTFFFLSCPRCCRISVKSCSSWSRPPGKSWLCFKASTSPPASKKVRTALQSPTCWFSWSHKTRGSWLFHWFPILSVPTKCAKAREMFCTVRTHMADLKTKFPAEQYYRWVVAVLSLLTLSFPTALHTKVLMGEFSSFCYQGFHAFFPV